ncbi:MAG: class I SAM-dependent methyltransferase [Planctomycetes bacterium]|nr:class I SAM-dependent methyltransferase [Planctomycetota bacterium]
MTNDAHESPGTESWRRLGFRQIEDEFGGREAMELRSEFIERTARAVMEARADLVEHFGHDAGSLGYWCWLNSFGVQEHRLLRHLLAPVPPREVFEFVGSDNELGYLETGANGYRMIAGLVAQQDRKLDDFRCVLDFGSGPGRMIRYFLRHWSTTGIVGADVDRRAIEWAQRNFPFGEFVVSSPEPPLVFPAASFDLIYAVSVFSHLSEANHLAWVEELRRVCHPDALVILTILGRHAHTRLSEEPKFRDWAGLDLNQLGAARREIDGRGFAFVRQESGHLDRDLYGVAFLTPTYIESAWAKHFELVDFKEAAIDDNQDAVVLRPR